MPFYSLFEDIFITLQAQHNNVALMAFYLIIHGLVITLRVVVFLAYRGHNILITMDMSPTKALNILSDTERLRSPLLRRIVNDYIAAAEKNAPRVPLDAIIDKHVLDLSFMGVRYAGISQWTEKLDGGLIFLGIILALIFPQYGVIYGIIAVVGFVLLKLVASLFDYNVATKLLSADINIYVEREVGQFYAGHTAGAVLKFKEEVAEAIDRQSVLLRGAVEKLSSDLIPALSHLGVLVELPKAMEYMRQSNERYAVHHEAFLAQAQIIKDIQAALEVSLSSYEATLQNLVQTMGNSMGTFIQYHGQSATDSLNAAINDHINRVAAANQETVSTIQALMGQLTTQSQHISTNLRALHEQIQFLDR